MMFNEEIIEQAIQQAPFYTEKYNEGRGARILQKLFSGQQDNMCLLTLPRADQEQVEQLTCLLNNAWTNGFIRGTQRSNGRER